ncbi:hypothetical protein [Amycolatopsis sp. CA-230715]|uniref:hypothetical protein n=1 Tax=Amycolatopsis sp. CA-230715 TaxID=2745196 RepID=UPI001C014920|nr:hypothetical protein [Amycolatopsis sp. CA-230715]QWF77527.1 hypothetical protein HUW46_00919 [Amycolatopsis sp. CA-230715]
MSEHDTSEPDNVDEAFAAIVAGLRAEGLGQDIVEERASKEPKAKSAEGKEKEPEPQDTGWRTGGTDWDATVLGRDPSPPDPDDPEEHYIPPEPPPLPKPRKGAFVVLLFFVVGILLLVAPSIAGVSATLATPLGILSLAIGLALLLLRVRQGPPDGADPTNGAQV